MEKSYLNPSRKAQDGKRVPLWHQWWSFSSLSFSAWWKDANNAKKTDQNDPHNDYILSMGMDEHVEGNEMVINPRRRMPKGWAYTKTKVEERRPEWGWTMTWERPVPSYCCRDDGDGDRRCCYCCRLLLLLP